MIYRVHIFYDELESESAGFAFFSNKRDAEQYAARHGHTTIDTIETPRTKKDVLRILRLWASHPDNG
jgi:hypothetical protein